MTTLYERIGGTQAVSAAVNLFYKKVTADPLLMPFFEGVDMMRLMHHQIVCLSYAFGGIPEYSGNSMREAHEHLNLKEEHFSAVAQRLKATLGELNVPKDVQDEVMAIAASTKDDVLGL